MKRYLLSTGILVLFLSNTISQTVTVNVTPANKKQTITALGAYMEPTMVDDLIFDIGSEILRIFPGSFDGYIDEPINDNGDPNNLDISKFTGMSGVKLTAVQKAVNNGVKILATVGSPPLWQKDTNSSNMYWRVLQAKGSPPSDVAFFRYCYVCGGELLSGMYPEFGEFAAGVVKIFKQQTGADLFAFIPQNEPEFAEPYGSCVYTGTQMLNATKAVGDKFATFGITTTKIGFADQCFPQHNFYSWAQQVNNDAICKNYVAAFSNHDYSDDPMGGGMAMPNDWAAIYKESQRISPVKETWMDEGGPGYNSAKTNIEISVGGAVEFYKAMYYGNASVFMVHSFSKDEPIRYGSIKNMIRFIRPGAYRVNAVCSTDTLNVMPLVFKHDGFGTTTIYVINKAQTEKKIKMNGITGTFDVFQTTVKLSCNWIGQVDLANDITLPAMSVTTMVNCTTNKLPNIIMDDTLVVIKNSPTKSFDLTGINDGGEGNQTITIKAWPFAQASMLFNNITITYTSPNTTGKLNLTPKTDLTGMTYINIGIRDNSKSLDSMFNEKIIVVPAYIIPYVNKAPSMSDIDNQIYTKAQINNTQLVTITNVNDGNDGKQKLTLTAASSAPWIATVTTQGSTLLKITPKAEGTITITVTLSDDGVNLGGGVGSITKTFTVTVGSGINEIEEPKSELLIYPNPAHDFLTISNPELNFNEMELIDLNGKILINCSLISYETTINVKSLQPGVYIIKLMNENKIQFIKILLE
jgi:O-glycosyl hydrolase